ncbi:hypothetical protein HDV01_000028 [Terramyces sp. JEL0728]|nr:hypothetical protein HDV01_000028 [Terramyces sp. JEL0728]
MPGLDLATSYTSRTVSTKNARLCEDSEASEDIPYIAILPSNEFKDLASLDSYLDSLSEGVQSNVQQFQQVYQCPNFKGYGIRFPYSTLCAFMVEASASQCQSQYKNTSAPPLVLCASTCNDHQKSISTILTNTSVCDASPSSTAAAARTAAQAGGGATTNLNDFCSSLNSNPAAQPGSQCINGTKAEFLACGFMTPQETKDFCAASPSEACCIMAAAASAPPPLSLLAPGNNVWVISGIVAGVLAVLGISFLIYQRLSKMGQRPTTAYNPQRRTQAKSKFFSFFAGNNKSPDLPVSNGKPRSSLFTTIRASTIFKSEAPPKLPTGPIQLPPAAKLNAFSELQEDPDYYQPQGGDRDNEVQVFEDYDAGMDDEMDCRVGDIIAIFEEFDDGKS